MNTDDRIRVDLCPSVVKNSVNIVPLLTIGPRQFAVRKVDDFVSFVAFCEKQRGTDFLLTEAYEGNEGCSL